MDNFAIVAAAQEEVRRMTASARNQAEDATVTMSVRQFRRLADLMVQLSAACLDAPTTDGAGELGNPRYWVPLEHFNRLKARISMQ